MARDPGTGVAPGARPRTKAQLVAAYRAQAPRPLAPSALAQARPRGGDRVPGMTAADVATARAFGHEHGTLIGGLHRAGPTGYVEQAVKDVRSGNVRGAALNTVGAASFFLPAGAVSGPLLRAGARLAAARGLSRTAAVLSSHTAQELGRLDSPFAGRMGARNRRAEGTNPRALGKNPRGSKIINSASRDEHGLFATPYNPRRQGTNPRASRGEQGPVTHYNLHVNEQLHSQHPDKQAVFAAANNARAAGHAVRIESVRASTHADLVGHARTRLNELEAAQRDFYQAAHRKMFNEKLTPDELDEQRNRNVYNGKVAKARSGKDAAGRVKGSNSRYTGASFRPSVRQEQQMRVEREIDKVVAANADHPSIKQFVADREELAKLRDALTPMPGEPVNMDALKGMLGFVNWTPAQYRAFAEREGASAAFRGDLSNRPFYHANGRRLIGDFPSTRYANRGVVLAPGIYANALPARSESFAGMEGGARGTPAFVPTGNIKGPGARAMTLNARSKSAAYNLHERFNEYNAAQGFEMHPLFAQGYRPLGQLSPIRSDATALEHVARKATGALREKIEAQAPWVFDRKMRSEHGLVTGSRPSRWMRGMILSSLLGQGEGFALPHRMQFDKPIERAESVTPLRVREGARVLDLNQPLGVGERSRLLHAVRELNRLRMRRGEIEPYVAKAINEKIALSLRDEATTLASVDRSLGGDTLTPEHLRDRRESLLGPGQYDYLLGLDPRNATRPLYESRRALDLLRQTFQNPEAAVRHDPAIEAAIEAATGHKPRYPKTDWSMMPPAAGGATLGASFSGPSFTSADVLRRLGYDALVDPSYTHYVGSGTPQGHAVTAPELVAMRDRAIEPWYQARPGKQSPKAVQYARALRSAGINMAELRKQARAAHESSMSGMGATGPTLTPEGVTPPRVSMPVTPKFPLSDELSLFMLGGRTPAIGRTAASADPVSAEELLRLLRNNVYSRRRPPTPAEVARITGISEARLARLADPKRSLGKGSDIAGADQIRGWLAEEKATGQHDLSQYRAKQPRTKAELEAFLRKHQPGVSDMPSRDEPVGYGLHGVRLPNKGWMSFSKDRNGRPIWSYDKPPQIEKWFEPGELALVARRLDPEKRDREFDLLQQNLNEAWFHYRKVAKEQGIMHFQAVKAGQKAGLSGAKLRRFIEVYKDERRKLQ